MNIEKLGKLARKEFLRSPKKTAALGLMCLVALYFWAPLVAKWLRGHNDAPPAGEIAVDDLTPAPALPAETSGSEVVAEAPQFHWRDFRSWIEADADMAPVEIEILTRDPFSGNSGWSLASVDEDDLVSQQAAEESTPQEAGLELGGTIIGPENRLAIINGRPYRENAFVDLAGTASSGAAGADPGGPPINGFRVRSIETDRVVLTRDGIDYALTMPRRDTIGDLVIRRAAQPAAR